MNWYIMLEGTKEIVGPFSKEEGLKTLEAFDGFLFSEQIFEPQFVTSEEAENLLAGMREFLELNKDEKFLSTRDSLNVMIQKSIDTIILLSREKLISASIEGGVFSVDEIPEGVKLEVNDYDTESYDENDLTEDESGEACKKLEFSKR